MNELSLEADREHRARVRALTVGWPSALRKHVDELLGEQVRHETAVPDLVVFVPIYHGIDDPQADATLEGDINELFDNGLADRAAVASGENHSAPYSADREATARTSSLDELQSTLQRLSPHAHLQRRTGHVAGFERAMQRVLREHPEIPIAGFESVSGAILANILENAPELVGLTQTSAADARWAVGIEARTRQALNRAADYFGKVRLFFLAGGFHGPGVDRWCQRNGVEFQMAVSEVMVQKLPDFYG